MEHMLGNPGVLEQKLWPCQLKMRCLPNRTTPETTRTLHRLVLQYQSTLCLRTVKVTAAHRMH